MAPLNHNALSDDELDIYSRQIVFSDIGYDGQLRLKNAKICLVGVGGLGSPTALKLTGMGIGLLRIVDRDIVSRSDLHRQHLYDTKSVGRPKVEVAMEKHKSSISINSCLSTVWDFRVGTFHCNHLLGGNTWS